MQDERIELTLPLAEVDKFRAWILREIRRGNLGQDGTLAAAERSIAAAVAVQGGPTIKWSPKIVNLQAVIKTAVFHPFAKILQESWCEAVELRRQPLPPPQIDPGVMEHVRSIPAEVLDYVPPPMPEESKRLPAAEKCLF